MNMRKRLDIIREFKDQHFYITASELADILYEDITTGRVKATEAEFHELFLYIDCLSDLICR